MAEPMAQMTAEYSAEALAVPQVVLMVPLKVAELVFLKVAQSDAPAVE